MPPVRTLARRTLLTVSALLLLATLATWLRARWVKDVFLHSTVTAPPGRVQIDTLRLTTQPHAVQLFIHRLAYLTPDAPAQATLLKNLPRDPRFRHHRLRPHPSDSRGFGFERFEPEPDLARSAATLAVNKRPYRVGGRIITLHAPWWSLALTFSLAPALSAWRRHRRARRRPKPGHCPHCHYDLRATPTRCPECGHPTGTVLP
jgi:hypothetical protein